MKEIRSHPSILSYFLTEGRHYCLRLQNSVSASHSPFKLLDSNDPLAHTFRGAFVTDYGSTIKEVDLLIQRDTTEWPHEYENSLTNSMVDQYWQQATTIRQTKGPEHSMLLASQLDKQLHLQAFASLFYCRKREIFFEPPCPECGKTLQLCKDDDLLLGARLPSYSKTLRRYLHCPSCLQNDNHQIYYTLEKEVNDPPTVHDCNQLIDEFSKINFDTGTKTSLPCLTCQNHELCFGSKRSAYNTIFVLSFYPFYMLIKECSSLEGFHMLSILRDQKLSSSPENNPVDSQNSDRDTDATFEKSNDEAILGIMQQMLAKHSQNNSLSSQDSPPSLLDETYIQTDDMFTESHTLQSPETTVSIKNSSNFHQAQDDLSMETVIIENSAEYVPDNRDTLQTKTVLLTDTPTMQSPAPKQPKTIHNQSENTVGRDTDDDLPETIILRPREKQ